jgi:VWFA-related protein
VQKKILFPNPTCQRVSSSFSLFKFIPLTALILGWATCLAAQQSTTTTSPEKAQQPSSNSISVLKVAVRRVAVDVVVTDNSGTPVKGLVKENFQAFEDGKSQQIRSFETHTSAPQPPLPSLKLPTNTFSNLSAAPQGGPITVILYDLLNTPLDAQPYAHAQLLKFLQQKSASSQIAIFVLSDKLHMLQGFMDDENQLIAALNMQRKRFYKSSMLQTPDEATQASSDLIHTEGNQNGSDASQDVSYQAIVGMLKHMEAIESSAMLDRRVDITVDALEEISRFLIGLPGRKNLLWLSGSFPAGIIPNGDLGGRDSFDVTRNYSSTIMKATDLLNLSHVAVYPVDVRGLQVNPMFSTASNQAFEPETGKDLKAVRDLSQQNAAEHATMDVIGNETGGRAFYNTNGLTQAVAAAVEDGSTYYTLTYAPANLKFDGRLRHVHIDLLKQGYHLSYRRSYFADNLDTTVQHSEDSPNDPLTVPLQYGAPLAHELFFEAHLQTSGQPVPATPQQMAALMTYESMAIKGKHKAELQSRTPVMMQHYLISYGLLLRQLDLPIEPDGARRGDLEFAVISYNEDGKKLNGIRTQVQDAIQPDRYLRMQNEGYQLLQMIDVPVQAVSLRLAVRDTLANHMGSLEIRLPLAQNP